MMSFKDLETLQRDLEVTQATLHDALTVVYPVGREVRVRLVENQKEPTPGTVIGHGTGRFSGEVRIRFAKKTQDFHWKRIVR